MRVFLLTAAALTGFAANSLLTRGALGGHLLDAASFTTIRLLSGAAMLWLLCRVQPRPADREDGRWGAALMLAGYAIFFTLAYRKIGAGVGALVLFGSVQITMIGTGLVRGERPGVRDWLGVALAVAGLLVFTVPGATAPDPLGTAYMTIAGACWGAYSLAGRRSRDPLGRTAGNFLLASVAGVVFAAIHWNVIDITRAGVFYALASGALASGVGYTLWYAALPHLAAWRAGVVQLIVPVATAVAATAMLGETITTRLAIATGLVVGGVVLTMVRR